MPSLERLARNEALFRQVNETISELSSALGDQGGAHHAFVCECADIDCQERLALTIEEYQHLRTRSDCFAVRPGHEMGPELERIVGQHCEYVIVEKRVEPD